MEHHSVTLWLNQLKQGDQSAAQKLWDRYGPTLVRLARHRFHACAGPAFDEEDLVQCVFTELWSAAMSGRLEKVQGRDDLWWLLLAITKRKALSRVAFNARQKRSGEIYARGHNMGAAPDTSVIHATTIDPGQPPPDLIMVLDEEQHRLLSLLRDDTLRSIAVWKFEGYSHEEIAEKLSVTSRTIIRKLNLIRKRWALELER